MTKLTAVMEEKTPLPPSPAPQADRPVSAPPGYTSQLQLDNAEEMKRSRVWYILSVLATIFCCLPCGMIGIVHSLLAHHDGELGRVGPQRMRLRKAKCCTCVSFGLGLAFVLITLGFAAYCGYWYIVIYNFPAQYGNYDEDHPEYDYIRADDPNYDADDLPANPDLSIATTAPTLDDRRWPGRGRDSSEEGPWDRPPWMSGEDSSEEWQPGQGRPGPGPHHGPPGPGRGPHGPPGPGQGPHGPPGSGRRPHHGPPRQEPPPEWEDEEGRPEPRGSSIYK